MNITTTGAGLSRRGFLGGLGALGLGLGLAACSSGGSASSTSTDLTVALWGDANRAKLYQSAIDLYVQKHEGTTLSLEYLDLTAYLERLATSAAAGSLPDFIWMRDTHIGRYAASGALLDLTPELGNGIDTAGLGDAGVATGKVGDGVFALPSHYVANCTLYDQTVLQSKGVDYSQVKTWDDYADAATELTDKTAGFYGSYDPTLAATQNHFEAWIRQYGDDVEVYSADGTAPGFEPVVFEEWLSYWDKLRKAGVLPAADIQIESQSSGWTNDLLVTSRAALRLASANHLTIVQGLRQTPVGMGVMPQKAGGTTDTWRFFVPILVSIAGNTDGADTAVSLMDFFINDTAAAELTRLNQGAPSSSTVRDALVPKLKPQEAQFVQLISDEMAFPRRPFPIRPAGSEAFNTAIARTGEEVAYGRQSVSAAVAWFMGEAQRALRA
ncbi:hypothetical protein BJF90_13865 [Pseudonocardia sp. CNS-004]|nr:hypothetical protein BJF90_13865 [Pseudonocardia sp. CNS-004]